MKLTEVRRSAVEIVFDSGLDSLSPSTHTERRSEIRDFLLDQKPNGTSLIFSGSPSWREFRKRLRASQPEPLEAFAAVLLDTWHLEAERLEDESRIRARRARGLWGKTLWRERNLLLEPDVVAAVKTLSDGARNEHRRTQLLRVPVLTYDARLVGFRRFTFEITLGDVLSGSLSPGRGKRERSRALDPRMRLMRYLVQDIGLPAQPAGEVAGDIFLYFFPSSSRPKLDETFRRGWQVNKKLQRRI